MTAASPDLISVSHLTALDAPPPDLVTAASDAGFGAVGIRVWPAAHESAYPMIGDTPMMKSTVARVNDTGIRVLDVEVLRFRPDTEHDHVLRILDAGAQLGAHNVLVICNDPDEQRVVDRFAATCEAAAERGMRACLEFMVFSSVKTLGDARRVVAKAGHLAGAILVDSLHLQRSGGTPAELAALPRELLPYAQLCDGPVEPVLPPEAVAQTEARGGRLFPGDGALPLRDLVHALPAGAPLAVEAPVAALAGLPPAERVRRAFLAVTRFLEQTTLSARMAPPPTA
jgi:sugar phosphate isomerase/epimerase